MALSLVVTLDLVVALVLAIPLASLAVSIVRVVALELAIALLRLTVALILTICLGLAVVSLGLAVVRLPGCARRCERARLLPVEARPCPRRWCCLPRRVVRRLPIQNRLRMVAFLVQLT